MCGFVAFFRISGREHSAEKDARWIATLASTIAHRGPDDSGIISDGTIAFAFRRLAILDLTPAGHQPLESPDGRFVMVFNGEIYNYIELREQLIALGHRFRSTGDSEVLLHSLMEWGEVALAKVVGMFAFTFFDRRTGVLLAARDHLGVKPLYFTKSRDGWLFASEIKAIRASGLGAYAPRSDTWADFLADGRSDRIGAHQSFYEGIDSVAPGTFVRIDGAGQMREVQYWSPASVPDDGATTIADVERLLDEAIELQLRADVPIAVMLSGGIDSTTIACSAARKLQSNGVPFVGHAFTYKSAEHDETAQLDAVLAQTGLTAHELLDTDASQVFGHLEKVLWYHDEPVHSINVLVAYELYGMAAQLGIRVMLVGQGADEAFGGYTSSVPTMLTELILAGRLLTAARQAGQFDRLTGSHGGSLLAGAYRSGLSRVLRTMGYKGRTSSAHVQWAAQRVHLSPEARNMVADHGAEFVPKSVGQALRNELSVTPLPQYLRTEDRNSMAHSVEARVPFLDHRLVETALRLPRELQLWDGWNKVALRRVAQSRIPEVVWKRRVKFGFPTNAKTWFAGDLANQLSELILDDQTYRSGLLSRPGVEKLLREHRGGAADHSNVLFGVAQAAVFSRLDRTGR